MLTFADELRSRDAGLRVLNLGGGDVDTATPMGSPRATFYGARDHAPVKLIAHLSDFFTTVER